MDKLEQKYLGYRYMLAKYVIEMEQMQALAEEEWNAMSEEEQMEWPELPFGHTIERLHMEIDQYEDAFIEARAAYYAHLEALDGEYDAER